MAHRFVNRQASRRMALLLVAAVMGGSTCAYGADDPVATAPGHTLYGDPAVPDISGLWQGSYEAIPDEVIQVPIEQRNIVRWAPWPPPQTPTYQAKADERIAALQAGKPIGDISARCLPFGQPHAFTGRVYPSEITQTPGVVSLWVFGTFPIMIWTDGRPHPAGLKPSYNGHSIGYWQGDTLYVDTVGILPGTMVDSARHVVHSGKLHMKTIFERVAPDVLHVHVTLYDDDAFTEPMVTTNIWRRKAGPDWQVLDDISCFENNRTDTAPAGFKKF